MEILITGSKGFIGRTLCKKLTDYNITSICRNDVDLCNTDEVDSFFETRSFNVIIHTSTSGGKRMIQDDSTVLENNVKMFFNLMRHRSNYDRFINIGSGAELDRSRDITKKVRMLDSFPVDPYGMSKNIIARTAALSVGITNIRGFGIFGEDESLDRFIRSNIIRSINNEDIVIHQDKCMDFFYIDDFVTLIDKVIKCEYSPPDIDCSYNEHYYLTEIATLIREVCESKSDIKINRDGMGNDYCGYMYPFIDEAIEFLGLREGIKRIYLNEVKNNGTI